MYERVFPSVGLIAPGFSLRDQSGLVRSMREFLQRDQFLVLSFVRGVDEAHTREQLDYLKDDYGRFRHYGAEVLVVTTGDVELNRRIKETQKLPFFLLSDAECHVIRMYGIYNEYDKLRGPAIYVLNRAGAILFMYQGKSPDDIVENEEIIKVFEGDTQTAPGWPLHQ
jgi:peroxiredoxin Q/BCP